MTDDQQRETQRRADHLAEITDEHLELGNEGGPFWCHAGMHHGAQGYVPRQRDRYGAPIGHPMCAGWIREHERRLNRPQSKPRRDVAAALGEDHG